MIFGKHQRDIRLEGRMTPDQSMAADFLGQPRHAEGFLGSYIFSGFPWYAGSFQRYCFYSCVIPTLLKMELEGGGVVLKFHFKILFLQSCFLND